MCLALQLCAYTWLPQGRATMPMPQQVERHGVGFRSVWVWVCPDPLEVHSHCKKINSKPNICCTVGITNQTRLKPLPPHTAPWVGLLMAAASQGEGQPRWTETVPHGPGLRFLSFSTIKQAAYNNCNICYIWRVMSFPTVTVQYTMNARYKKEESYQDLKFSQQCCWGFGSLEMWYCVVGSWHFKGTMGIHLHKSIRPQRNHLFLRWLILEDKRTMFPCNIRNHSPSDMVPHSTRLESTRYHLHP